ncbi:MAG: hypothetical protein Q9183_003998, partial [Haloplaca sp. 2 TL-2023]
VLVGIRLVLERTTGQARQLAMMPVIEDGKVLPIGGEVCGQPGTAKGVDDGICSKRGGALFAVGDQGLARGGHLHHRLLGGLVLRRDQVFFGDFAGIVVGVGNLKVC